MTWVIGRFMVALAAVFLVIAVVGFAGWRLHWWFAAQDATRQYQVTQNGVSNQTTLRQQITQQIANVDQITVQIAEYPSLDGSLEPQRAAVAATVCQDASEISGIPLPAQQAQWVSANCLAGTLRPGSAYYVEATP